VVHPIVILFTVAAVAAVACSTYHKESSPSCKCGWRRRWCPPLGGQTVQGCTKEYQRAVHNQYQIFGLTAGGGLESRPQGTA